MQYEHEEHEDRLGREIREAREESEAEAEERLDEQARQASMAAHLYFCATTGQCSDAVTLAGLAGDEATRDSVSRLMSHVLGHDGREMTGQCRYLALLS